MLGASVEHYETEAKGLPQVESVEVETNMTLVYLITH